MDTAALTEPLHIADFLAPDAITFLQTDDRLEVINQLCNKLEDQEILQEREPFFEALIERENIVSTAIGMGVAIPHAKLPTFDDFFIALGIHQGDGIEWDAIDQLPVHLIFLIGGPASEQKLYLNILSRITSAMRDETLRSKLLHAHTKAEVHSLLRI